MQSSYELVTITWQRLLTQSLLGVFGEPCRTGTEWSLISKWWAVKHLPSNSPKNQGETGIFAEGDVEIKDTGQQN